MLFDTAKDYQVQRLTTYAYELAYAFSVFYRDVRVLGSGKYQASRLLLVKLCQQTVASLLQLLGIKAPKRM